MKDGFIKIAAATPEIRVADCKYNAEQIIALAKKGAEQGVKLLCLPELCVTGYTCQDLFFQPTLIDAAWEACSEICRKTAELDTVLVFGAPVKQNSKLYNCAIVSYHGEILGVVPKKFLPNYNEFYEKRHFESGFKPMIFRCRELPEFSFAVELCEDLWAVEPPSIALAMAGANIILNCSASNEMIGKADYRRQLVCGQSGRLICAYVYSSAGDGESTQDMVFAGHNVIAENGSLLCETRLFENRMIATEADVQRLANERRKNTTFTNDADGVEFVEFSMPLTETKLTRYIAKTPFVPTSDNDRASRCEAILAMQSNGLKKRLMHTRAQTAVIGISGGLDSCLALLVAVNAMDLLKRPRTDVAAVTMPCFGTTKRTKSNAEILCRELGVTFREIDITAAVKQHFSDIGHDIDNHNVVFENGQARERTKILMDVANQMNGLVIGTGDLSELALGWATYNGDHMSMYGVNASVPKTLIRHIVKFYGDTAENEALRNVLLDILDTPVSPELLPVDEGKMTQITEDLVGPYELHDFFLYYAIRWGFPPKKVYRLARYAFGNSYDKETVLKWLKTFYRRFFSQQFKRSCLPDSAKVGSVTLSPRADWRMPSDACSALWLEQLENL